MLLGRISAFYSEVYFTSKVQVNWREWLNDSRDSHSDDVKNMRVLYKEHKNITISRSHTLNRQRFTVLVERNLNDSWVRQIDTNADT